MITKEVIQKWMLENNGSILSQSDVSRLLNKSRGWVRERLEVKKDGITVEALAMKLAREFV